MEAAGYAFAALVLAGGALVSLAQLVEAWRRGECALLWNTIVVRRAEGPVRFHLVMIVWTPLCLFLAGLLVVSAYLLARVAFG